MTPLRLSAEDSKIIPHKWQPDVAQAIDSSSAELKNATAQMQMNALSRQTADMKDAQLFVVYGRLYERLNSKARAQLLAEQRNGWRHARKRRAMGSNRKAVRWPRSNRTTPKLSSRISGWRS